MVTVIVAVPSLSPVTTPSATVATSVSSEAHVTTVSVAFEGAIVAVSVSEPPTEIVVDSLLSVTPVTATGLTKKPPLCLHPCTLQL